MPVDAAAAQIRRSVRRRQRQIGYPGARPQRGRRQRQRLSAVEQDSSTATAAPIRSAYAWPARPRVGPPILPATATSTAVANDSTSTPTSTAQARLTSAAPAPPSWPGRRSGLGVNRLGHRRTVSSCVCGGARHRPARVGIATAGRWRAASCVDCRAVRGGAGLSVAGLRRRNLDDRFADGRSGYLITVSRVGSVVSFVSVVACGRRRRLRRRPRLLPRPPLPCSGRGGGSLRR